MTIYNVKSTTIQDFVDNLSAVDEIIDTINKEGDDYTEYKRSLKLNKNGKNDYNVELKLWKEKN